MSKGEESRNKILQSAFRLFATYPYEKVSFSLLETQIGISRGSMIYYFKNKEGLFKEVIETYVFNASSIKAVPDAYKLSLASFYNYFIEILERQKSDLKDFGIVNQNKALLQIELSAISHLPDFRDYALNWYNEEIAIWRDVITNAIAANEIKSDIDVEYTSSLFEHSYLGISFVGVYKEKGYDINGLKETYNQIYELIRKQNPIG